MRWWNTELGGYVCAAILVFVVVYAVVGSALKYTGIMD